MLRFVGSLWFAAVLLVLLLVAMACATVFESAHGAEQALAAFYRAQWFELLLALLGVNVLAALVARYPFTKRQTGFVLTHISILLTLTGALVTEKFGVNGQLGIAEGQTVSEFTTSEDTLTVKNLVDKGSVSVDLNGKAFRGFEVVDNPPSPLLESGNLRVEVLRFLPHGVTVDQVVDNNTKPHPAVEVSFSSTGRGSPTWLFVNQPGVLERTRVTYRVVTDDELTRLLSDQRTEAPGAVGLIKVQSGGSTFHLSLAECLNHPVKVGDSGYTLRVVRYMPHAQVGPDNKLRSVSDNPLNPAVEIELTGPENTKEKRFAFAKFPEFGSMHGEGKVDALTVTFIAPTQHAPTSPIEVLQSSSGALHVRFTGEGGPTVTHELTIGQAVESPWPGMKFAVLRRFDHARKELAVTPADPPAKGREPAVLVELSASGQTSQMWLRKHRPGPVTVDGTPYELTYSNKIFPLGFTVELNRFRVGYYPGGNRPRSFESSVTITDPTSGRTQSRVISMNSPTSHGGYTLYQSMYRIEPGVTISYLSVARDPGTVIVFAGYIGMIAGMIVVLATRATEKRRAAAQGDPTGAPTDQGRSPSRRVVPLQAQGIAATRES